jgi:predicted aconitase with swiveling domain
VLAGIPLVDRLDGDPLTELNDGDIVVVNGDQGFIEVVSS